MIDLGTYTRPHGYVPVDGSPLKLIVTSETTRNLVMVDAEADRPAIRRLQTDAPIPALPHVRALDGLPLASRHAAAMAAHPRPVRRTRSRPLLALGTYDPLGQAKVRHRRAPCCAAWVQVQFPSGPWLELARHAA